MLLSVPCYAIGYTTRLNYNFISPRYGTRDTEYDNHIRYHTREEFLDAVYNYIDRFKILWTDPDLSSVHDGQSIMTISVLSGLNSDGFSITIRDEESGETLFDKEYRYGWSASWEKGWATESKPYVTDIISDLKQKYNVVSIDVVSGRNVFRGGQVNPEAVQEFKDTYLQPLSSIISTTEVDPIIFV